MQSSLQSTIVHGDHTPVKMDPNVLKELYHRKRVQFDEAIANLSKNFGELKEEVSACKQLQQKIVGTKIRDEHGFFSKLEILAQFEAQKFPKLDFNKQKNLLLNYVYDRLNLFLDKTPLALPIDLLSEDSKSDNHNKVQIKNNDNTKNALLPPAREIALEPLNSLLVLNGLASSIDCYINYIKKDISEESEYTFDKMIQKVSSLQGAITGVAIKVGKLDSPWIKQLQNNIIELQQKFNNKRIAIAEAESVFTLLRKENAELLYLVITSPLEEKKHYVKALLEVSGMSAWLEYFYYYHEDIIKAAHLTLSPQKLPVSSSYEEIKKLSPKPHGWFNQIKMSELEARIKRIKELVPDKDKYTVPLREIQKAIDMLMQLNDSVADKGFYVKNTDDSIAIKNKQVVFVDELDDPKLSSIFNTIKIQAAEILGNSKNTFKSGTDGYECILSLQVLCDELFKLHINTKSDLNIRYFAEYYEKSESQKKLKTASLQMMHKDLEEAKKCLQQQKSALIQKNDECNNLELKHSEELSSLKQQVADLSSEKQSLEDRIKKILADQKETQTIVEKAKKQLETECNASKEKVETFRVTAIKAEKEKMLALKQVGELRKKLSELDAEKNDTEKKLTEKEALFQQLLDNNRQLEIKVEQATKDIFSKTGSLAEMERIREQLNSGSKAEAEKFQLLEQNYRKSQTDNTMLAKNILALKAELTESSNQNALQIGQRFLKQASKETGWGIFAGLTVGLGLFASGRAGFKSSLLAGIGTAAVAEMMISQSHK